MAPKRAAGKQLTQDNYEEPDRYEPEADTGPAPPEVLAKRVIRTAKRRNVAQNEEKKGIFSGFNAFNRAPTDVSTAFSFLSKIAETPKSAEPIKPFTFSTEKQSETPKSSETVRPFTFSTDKKLPDETPKTTSERTQPFTFSTDKKLPAEASKTNESPRPFTFSTTKTPLAEMEKASKPDDEYYENLKGLNLSVSEWIQTHVDKNPHCILTPVFDDYIKHLKDLDPLKTKSTTSAEALPTFKFNETPFKPVEKPKTESPAASFSIVPILAPPPPPANGAPPSFSLGFTFGTTSSSADTLKPFTFSNAAVVPPPASSTADEDSEEPPKVTFSPVVEGDSVYSKRCKVFIKKADSFADRGIGVLYIKPIKDSDKYQAIVRADTSLGNLLLNIILSEGIPVQKTGKNNVMLVCVPDADAKPPPVPVLLRVKTVEEADELLNKLNAYKK